jgi:hypothetical protein
MLIPLKLSWTSTGTYGDRNGQEYGETFAAASWSFDTATRLVVYTPFPLGGDYNYDQSSGSTVPPPVDYSRDVTEEFHVYVSGPTRIGYFHDGAGGFTTVITTLTFTWTVVDATCFGASSAAIVVVPDGMNGPFAYLWQDGVTTSSRSFVPAGVYRLTLTDLPSGAIARNTIRVGQNPQLTVLVQKVRGDVTLTVSGGIGLYTYLWSDGATTRDRTGLLSGAYTCLITDALGCETEVAVRVDTDLFYFSRNPITLPLDAGAAYRLDPTTKPHLSFLCEVWVERAYRSGTFEQVGGVQEQPADRAGRTEFQVQALLDGFLEAHVPAPNATGLERADPLFRRFYLKYAERYDDPPVVSGTTTLQENYVLLGGLNSYEARTRAFFDVYQPTVMPFLTWEPPVKAVLSDQPEYLYYLVTQSPAGFRFQLRVHLSDGSQVQANLGGADNVHLHEVFCRPVGYQALGLAALAAGAGPDLRVVWWEIFVTTPDGATRLSEVRRYELDPRYFPDRRYFLFATSLGGMATYAATGEALVDAEVTGEEAARTLQPTDDWFRGDTVVQTRSLRPVLKAASGKRTPAQMAAAQDLLLSRRVLLLRDGRWLPGYVKARTSPLLDESKALATQEFEFYLTTEQLYTPALGAAQFTYHRRLL